MEVSRGDFRLIITVVFDVIRDILSVLISWDVQTFFIVNHSIANAVFDFLFPILTTTKNWLPIYLVSISYLLYRGYRTRHGDGRRLIVCATVLIGSVALADQLSHQLLKEVIQRPRPYVVLEQARQLVGSGGGSFPSNHAMNSAIFAVILSTFFPQLRTWWWSYALLIGFSRIYCGVHYPSDVLGGFAIGIVWAMIVLRLLQRLWPQLPIGPPPRA